MNTLEGLKKALAIIETNGWWNGKFGYSVVNGIRRACVVTATYWVEVADGEGLRCDSELELQFPLWNALPPGCRTSLGRTKDLIDFNDSHTEVDVKALFQRAIDACTT